MTQDMSATEKWVAARIAEQGFQDYESTIGEWASGIAYITANVISTVNAGISVRWRPKKNRTIRSLTWFTGGVISGNYDIAILESNGTRLWSQGSTPWPAANSVVSVAVTPLAVTANTEYQILFSVDNTTANWRGPSASFSDEVRDAQGLYIARSYTAVFPIPTSVVPGSTPSPKFPKIVLREV